MVQHELYLPIESRRLYDLSSGAMFNELERTLPPVSRSRHYLTLNVSETVQDTDIVYTVKQ